MVSSVAKDLWWLKWDIFHLNIEWCFLTSSFFYRPFKRTLCTNGLIQNNNQSMLHKTPCSWKNARATRLATANRPRVSIRVTNTQSIILDSTKEGVWGTAVTVASRGEAQVGGLGTNPIWGMGNGVPQKLTTFLGLKVYFTQNKSLISYFNITHSCQCLKTLLLQQISITWNAQTSHNWHTGTGC